MENIAEILKNFPQGTKLWSNVIGDCRLKDFSDDEDIIVTREDGDVAFSKFGEYEDGSGLCNLFPSQFMSDWEKLSWKKGDVLCGYGYNCIFEKWLGNNFLSFKAKFSTKKESTGVENALSWYKSDDEDVQNQYIHEIENEYGGTLNLGTLEIEKEPEFKDGDIVYIGNAWNEYIGIIKNIPSGNQIETYAHCHKDSKEKAILGLWLNKNDSDALRPATDSEKQQLFSALEKEGKVWNPDTKQIEDLPKECEFKPFDKVLVRMEQNKVWRLAFFIKKSEGSDKNPYPYHALNIEDNVSDLYAYCIPYNDQTKHLLGTTDDWKG